MKLLHVHDFFAPGNSRHGFDMDRLLAARGHEAHVLAGVGGRGPSDGGVVEGVTFHTYPFREDLPVWSRFRRARRLNAERFETLQEKYGFDLVVLNQPLCASGVLRSMASIPPARVYSFISSWADEWRAAHPEAGPLSRWVQAGLRGRMEDRAVRECDAVLVESGFVRDRLRELHPSVPDAKVTLIPGAVDLERFRPEGTREENRGRFGIGPGPAVLTVRRLVARMGIDLLLRAAAEVPDVQVLIGGEGPLRSELEALARSLGVRARFLGYVPDGDLPALYRSVDLFVLPTRALEGFGLVAIEAMACGTPALGTPVGAIPEVLGPPGLLFKKTDVGAMAEGLRGFFAAKDEDLGRRCREYVASRYDWRRVIEDFEALFLRVIREGPGHRRQ